MPCVTENGFTPQFEAEVLDALYDADQSKNVSKKFTSAKALIADLHQKTQTV